MSSKYKRPFSDVVSGTINVDKLLQELQATVAKVQIVSQKNFPTQHYYDDQKPTELLIQCSEALSAQEESDMDTIIADHEEYSLDEYKAMKRLLIDQKTVQLIGEGFVYNNDTYSLSIGAQTNWNALKANKNDFSYPKPISTKDDKKVELADTTEVDALWVAGKDAVDGHLNSGRDLKESINNATDKAGVDAVADNR